jgi:predicted PurR-regulated permease PerM
MNEKKQKKGVVPFFMVFVFLSVVLVFLFAFATPLLIDIQTGMYNAAEIALDDADNWASQINDADVKTQIETTLDTSRDSIPDQIEIMGFFFQYSWVIIILVVLFVIFMMTRTTVERETGYV